MKPHTGSLQGGVLSAALGALVAFLPANVLAQAPSNVYADYEVAYFDPPAEAADIVCTWMHESGFVSIQYVTASGTVRSAIRSRNAWVNIENPADEGVDGVLCTNPNAARRVAFQHLDPQTGVPDFCGLYHEGRVTPLPALIDPEDALTFNGINDWCIVTGNLNNRNAGYLTTPSKSWYMEFSVPGSAFTVPLCVNNWLATAGWFAPASGALAECGFIYDGWNFVILDATVLPPPATYASYLACLVSGINDRNQCVGIMAGLNAEGKLSHDGFVWDAGRVAHFTIPEARRTELISITNSGLLCGNAKFKNMETGVWTMRCFVATPRPHGNGHGRH